MTSAQFSKLKELFSYKACGGILTKKESEDLRRLWDMAMVDSSGPVHEWMTKNKYYEENPLSVWGL